MNKKISFLFLVVLIGFLTVNIAKLEAAKGGDEDSGGATDVSGQYVFGWAWGGTSETGGPGVGWIKFNSCNDDNPRDGQPDQGCVPSYGVKVDTNNGKVSGYAWSSNVGWISFNRSDTGAPPSDDAGSSDVIAKFEMAKGDFNGKINGWARVLSGMDSTTDGWDGWIHLSDTSSNPSRHPSGYNDGSKGVSYNKDAGTIVGYAWGAGVLGWIKFVAVTFGGNSGPFDYNLSNSGNIQVVAGGSGQVSIAREYVSGTAEPVTISITSPAITGVTPVLGGNNPCTPYCSSNITFNVAANTVPQTYNIAVKGRSSSGIERTTNFNLTVTPPVGGQLTISCIVDSDPPYLINKPVTWSAEVSGATLGTPPYTADWQFTSENEPSSTGHSDASQSPITISKTYSKIGRKTAVATVTDSSPTPLTGVCSAAAEINVVVKTNEIHK